MLTTFRGRAKLQISVFLSFKRQRNRKGKVLPGGGANKSSSSCHVTIGLLSLALMLPLFTPNSFLFIMDWIMPVTFDSERTFRELTKAT